MSFNRHSHGGGNFFIEKNHRYRGKEESDVGDGKCAKAGKEEKICAGECEGAAPEDFQGVFGGDVEDVANKRGEAHCADHHDGASGGEGATVFVEANH